MKTETDNNEVLFIICFCCEGKVYVKGIGHLPRVCQMCLGEKYIPKDEGLRILLNQYKPH